MTTGMTKNRKRLLIVLGALFAVALLGWWLLRGHSAEIPFADVTGLNPQLAEPSPETIPTVQIAEPIGWAKGEHPESAPGLEVSRFAEGLEHPRTLYTMPNGDVLVTLSRSPEQAGGVTGYFYKKAGAAGQSPNKLVLLRDANGDGRAEIRQVLRDDLDSPSGLAYADGTLYVANHNALLAFPYSEGELELTAKPQKLMDLPAGGGHWVRNIIHTNAAPGGNNGGEDGPRIYIAVGSASNIGENGAEAEKGRAMIWEYDIRSKSARAYATGLRNPNGLAFNPASGELWTTVNERDMLGSDLVPDYLTNVPVGAQYGWPWVYWKKHFDRRVDIPQPQYLVEYTRKPEVALGPHVAALGLVFSTQGHRMGKKWGQGAFIAQHGSWNRKPPSGYDVVYVPFDERGNPVGKPITVLGGFLRGDGKTHGRPTWVSWAGDGALLLSDDTAGIIWRVIDPEAKPAGPIARPKSASLPPLRSLKSPEANFADERPDKNPPQ